MDKKRDLLSKLDAAIIALTRMGEDAATLEIMDNAVASKRLKRNLANFKHGELEEFTAAVLGCRKDIISKPKRRRSGNTPLISEVLNNQ